MLAPPRVDRYQVRAGSGLTPQLVSGILRTADFGDLQRLADLLDEVREKDGHLQSVLSKRAGAVSGSPWELQPSPRSSKGRGAKILALCTDVLQNIERLPALLEDLLDGAYHGRACSELFWTRDGRYQVPFSHEFVHPRRFRYGPNDWQLRIWDSGAGTPFNAGYGIPVAEINRLIPGKLLVHSPRVRGGYPTREGLGRTTVWYSGVFKAFGWRDFLAYLEQYGRPLRIGTFGTGKGNLPMASDEDVTELEAALDALSSAASAVFPDTTLPTLLPPATASAGAAHPELIRLCDAETSKVVLGGTLTTDAGTRGARSLGDTHKEEEILLAKRDALALAETIRRYLLAPIVVLNGLGDASDAPLLRFVVDPAEDQNALAERFKTLGEAGVPVPVAHIRSRLAIPEPVDGEECIGGAPAAPEALPVDPNAQPSKGPKKPAPKPKD